MIILDTSGLLSALDASQRHHAQAAAALKAEPGPWLLSPFVLAELDYLLATKVSQEAALDLMEEVGRGAYRLEAFQSADIRRAHEIALEYADMDVGLADASLVVLSERHGERNILTLDERHFRTLKAVGGQPFRLLPRDWY